MQLSRLPAAVVSFVLLVTFHHPSFAQSTNEIGTKCTDGEYLSDNDIAYLYLETLQEIAYSGEKNPSRWTGDRKQLEKLQKLLKELNKNGSSTDKKLTLEAVTNSLNQSFGGCPSTRFEDPLSFSILNAASKNILQELATQERSFVAPRMGTLPSGTLNARTLKVPGTDKNLLIVNSSLFTFAHELSKIGLSTVSINLRDDNVVIDLKDDDFTSLRSDVKFLTRFSMALEDFANNRKIVGHERPRPLDAPLLVEMTQAVEEFVLAHEFAHIILGHNAHIERENGLTKRTESEIKELWGREAMADLYATALVQRIAYNKTGAEDTEGLQGLLNEYKRYAPVFYFQLSQIAESAHFAYQHKKGMPKIDRVERTAVVNFLSKALEDQIDDSRDQNSKSIMAKEFSLPEYISRYGDHPPTWARKALVQAYWSDQTPRVDDEVTVAFGEVAINMGQRLEMLWSDLEPIWIGIANQNKTD